MQTRVLHREQVWHAVTPEPHMCTTSAGSFGAISFRNSSRNTATGLNLPSAGQIVRERAAPGARHVAGHRIDRFDFAR